MWKETPRRVPVQNVRDNNSALDSVLKNLGFNCEDADVRRSSLPPCILQTSSLTGPTTAPPTGPHFPFATDRSQILRQTEAGEWQTNHIDALIKAYQAELEDLDELADANISQRVKATPLERRKQDYFRLFESLLNAPNDVFRTTMTQMISVQKLWRNRSFIADIGDKNLPERCCAVKECPAVAIHGSRFCGWHILKDDREQLFVKCPQCKIPRLNDFKIFTDCPGHKEKKRNRAVKL